MTLEFFTPTTLFFGIVVIGYLIGKIKICNMSLDLTAILVVAVIAGYFISKYGTTVVEDNFYSSMELFSKMGTNIFVAAIGLSSGNAITKGSGRKTVKCFVMGVFMVCIGFGVTKMISLMDEAMNTTLLKGILCGALTSTPGLTSVCETAYHEAELASVGYGAAYLFGVFGVAAFVQFLMKQTKCLKREETDTENMLPSDGMQILVIICLAVIVGQAVGNFEMPGMKFTLGNTGGVLVSAIIMAIIIKKHVKNIKISRQSLSIYRTFGLVLFFVGTGVSSGQKISYSLDIKWFIYGALITGITILLGYVIFHYGFKIGVKECMIIIAGGMTSTPAIGVILKNADGPTDMSAYSATYLGALITMTLGVRWLL